MMKFTFPIWYEKIAEDMMLKSIFSWHPNLTNRLDDEDSDNITTCGLTAHFKSIFPFFWNADVLSDATLTACLDS